MVFLITTASVALAKPGQNMEYVCWVDSNGNEQFAYFMTTGSGIVQRFKLDGKHDTYRPVSVFGSMPDESGWQLWLASYQDPCLAPNTTPGSPNDYLIDGDEYWHRYNN